MTSVNILNPFGTTSGMSRKTMWSPSAGQYNDSINRDRRRMPVDVYDDGKAFTVLAFVPGIAKPEIVVTVEKSSLTIEADGTGNGIGEDTRTLLNESYRGKLGRKIRLGSAIDVESAHSRLDNGVLTIVLPKVEADFPRRLPVLG